MQNFISIFTSDTPSWDLFLWGTLKYFFLFLLIQRVNRKQAGEIDRANMRRSLVTYDELTEQMRLEGIKSLKIEKAYIESDGDLSFILYEEKPRKLRTD